MVKERNKIRLRSLKKHRLEKQLDKQTDGKKEKHTFTDSIFSKINLIICYFFSDIFFIPKLSLFKTVKI